MKLFERDNFKIIMFVSGAIFAYLYGSSTATGQEPLQFYASYGYRGLIGLFITLATFGWATISILRLGQEKKTDELFKYYFGDLLGRIFEWLVMIFLFGIVVTLISGSGSVIFETFGISKYIGSFLIAAIIFVTVLLKLNNLVNVIGAIGPLLIIFTIIVSVISIVNNFGGFNNVEEIIASIDFPKGTGKWWLSAIIYSSGMFMTIAPFLLKLGTDMRRTQNAVLVGGGLGSFMLVFVIGLIALALLANLELIEGKATPLVYLSQIYIHPILVILFSIIIILGVYSTAAPMLWTICDNFISDQSSVKYKWLAAGLSAFALIGGAVFPFETLVGTVYPIMGYIGIVLYLAIGYYQIVKR